LAILAELALEVYSVERLPELADRALRRLTELGYANVHLTTGNGSLGWAEYAPYEGMIVAAGAPTVPTVLVDQMAEGGRLVIPVGSRQAQVLTLVEKHAGGLSKKDITGCVFVPLLGEHGWPLEE
ncbi:MAG: protein-L-isoaspartate O-methyltransferase, partial [Candidatus Omnitrophica bacterium]|nr:protein-L-isoaspartate O-methyltransferase [Candidatus Omnitrophota bacterium]